MEPTITKPDQPAGIRSDETYRLDRFKFIAGLNDQALRQARRRGLKIRKIGRRKFVVGSEFVEYLKSCPEA